MKLPQTLKKTFPVTLLLMYFINAQSVLVLGQVNMIDYLSQRFNRYIELVPREEVFVSSDREEYVAGEELWFSIWLTDRQRFCSSNNSKIVYLEMLNPENNPVVQKRISIDKGTGQGHIELPDTLTPGTYTIRAYTNWMKNFLPDNCFMKEIKIYNAFRPALFKNKADLEDGLMPETMSDSSRRRIDPLITLKVNNPSPDTLEILIDTDEKYRSENNDLCYLFIQTHGIINHVGTERITNEQTKIKIPGNLLIPGINQITIFNSKGKPVCERYIYTPDYRKQQLNINSAESYNTRTKVPLEISLEDSLSSGLNSMNMCISVSPVTGRNRSMELKEYMIFGSEFGLFPGRKVKWTRMDELPREVIDSLLMKIKSNWIDWRSILSDKLPEFEFKIEKEDQYLSGILLTSDNQLANPGEFILLSIAGKIPVFSYARTNYEAKFSFGIPIKDGIRDLIIQPDDITKNYKIFVEPSFSDIYYPSKISIDSTGESIPSYISKWFVNYQVGKIYGSSAVGPSFLNPSFSPPTPKRFYGKPDAEVFMKDWIKLPLMEEVFFEIVPHLTLKKRGPVYEMLLTDPFGKILYDMPPAMMIDGVIIKDPALIANFDPENVEKIDVVKEQYMVGDYVFDGIVNIITKSGDFGNIPLPFYSIRMQSGIFDSIPIFVSPDYSFPAVKNNHEPDFRNTLYWNPAVKPGIDGKVSIEFWTSDITNDYEINVQGITSEGKVLSVRKTISVR